MAASSGREEAAAASLPNSRYLWNIYMLCISDVSPCSRCLLWRSDAAQPSRDRGYPVHGPHEGNCTKTALAASTHYALLSALTKITHKKMKHFKCIHKTPQSPPHGHNLVKERGRAPEEPTTKAGPSALLRGGSETALKDHDGHTMKAQLCLSNMENMFSKRCQLHFLRAEDHEKG